MVLPPRRSAALFGRQVQLSIEDLAEALELRSAEPFEVTINAVENGWKLASTEVEAAHAM